MDNDPFIACFTSRADAFSSRRVVLATHGLATTKRLAGAEIKGENTDTLHTGYLV